MNKNSVIFKGVQNGIIIVLDNEIPFKKLQKVLLKKIRSAKSFFKGANTSITFKGRELSEDEEMKLLEIISKESGLEISFVNKIATVNHEKSIESNLNNNDSNKNSNKKCSNKDISSHYQNQILNCNNITYFHKGSIRSGQRLDFKGNIVIIGDINPGGEIYAEGNIIILGKLKGVVHAGCKGGKNCFISALHMNPTQLIIGDCLAYFPNDIKRDIVPEYAYVKDEQIFVESLINL